MIHGRQDPGASRPLKICLFGASIDTGNLGVSALCLGVLRMLFQATPTPQVTVFDEGRGQRSAEFHSDGRALAHRLCGERPGKRIWRSESLWNIRASCKLGGLWNPSARALLEADTVLDITGGDSFTDLYGPRRFNAVTLVKRIALENDVPLILLPQTYGPFKDLANRKIAESIVQNAAMAWARDERSFQILKELAGSRYDPARHLCGVDVAFMLEPIAPPAVSIASVEDWLVERSAPLIGLNVSGLIYNNPTDASQQYGLKADYREVIHAFVKHLLRSTDANVLLIPHVLTAPGHFESDPQACEDVAAACPDQERIRVLPPLSDPRHVKWLIAQTDWFCGTRMHATIAGLSSGIPTAAIAYSAKTLGVFETCGQGAHVADPRTLGTQEMVDRLICSWNEREAARRSLNAALPAVIAQAKSQMERIVRYCSTGGKSYAEAL